MHVFSSPLYGENTPQKEADLSPVHSCVLDRGPHDNLEAIYGSRPSLLTRTRSSVTRTGRISARGGGSEIRASASRATSCRPHGDPPDEPPRTRPPCRPR